MMDFVAGTAIPEHYMPFLRSTEMNVVLAKLGMGMI